MPFPKGISLKVNIIAWLEFKLAYSPIFNHNAMVTHNPKLFSPKATKLTLEGPEAKILKGQEKKTAKSTKATVMIY